VDKTHSQPYYMQRYIDELRP